MSELTGPRIARLQTAEKISFGPLSHYQNLLGAGDTPIFTGVQTCEPGYQTPAHFHPYVESLFIIDGVMETWMVGADDAVHTLRPGDMIALPANQPHVFRNPGPGVLRLLGVHANPERIVHRLDGT